MFTIDRTTARAAYVWHLDEGDRPLTPAANEAAIAAASAWAARTFVDDSTPAQQAALVETASEGQLASALAFVSRAFSASGEASDSGWRPELRNAEMKVRVLAYWIVLDATREKLREMFPNPGE